MNIEFDAYKQKLNDCRPALEGLADSLNLEGMRNELERLHAMQEAPGFWDDPEKSQKVAIKVKQTEARIERYEKMVSSWEDMMTICEMAEEEDDDSMLEELKEGFETLTQEMENCIPDTYRDSAADARELGQLLDAFLRTLTPDNQMVFLRRYWYVDTIAEIAARYGISESAVQMRLNRTKQKLSAYLAKEGIRV